MHDVTILVRTALELSPITADHSKPPAPKLHALPLHELSLPREPSWAAGFDTPSPFPAQMSEEVIFDKAADREILIAAKRYGNHQSHGCVWYTSNVNF